MKKLFLATLLIQAGAFLSAGAPTSIFINNSPLTTPPQVDATAFWNRSTINIFTTLPYQAQNVQFWTNTGVMQGSPGFLFEYDLDGKRARQLRANSRNLQRPSTAFVNSGNISVAPATGIILGSTISQGSIISINAKNVINSGRLDGNEVGLIKILATNGLADLSRSGIRVGPATGLSSPCDFLPFGTNFFPDASITDLYWGAGQNNAIGTNGQPLNLQFAASLFNLPSPRTPTHEVLIRSLGRTFTNTASLPGGSLFGGGCSGLYDAYVHTNFINATSILYNLVFVPTNSLLQASNLSVDVRFAANSGPGGQLAFAPVVEFRSVDFDITDQQFATNYVTFMDTSAAETNIVIARPFNTGIGSSASARRPNTYNLVKGRFCNFDFSQPANGIFNPAVFYNPNFTTNVVNTIYAAYSAQVGQTNSTSFTPSPIITGPLFQQLGVNPAVSDPTNFSGRTEITADRLNLYSTRIRAENFISIKAKSLVSNVFAQIDAPFVSFDVQSTNAELVIENLAPATVNRLSGQISAWSTVWSVDVTNAASGAVQNLRFHVLLLDNCLRSSQPVTLHRFAARAPALVIRDNILVNSAVSVDAATLCIESNATLALPVGVDFAFTNVHSLRDFTNNGVVSIQGGAFFGRFDAGHQSAPPKRGRKKQPLVPAPLSHFVNHNSMTASALFVRSTNTEIIGLGTNAFFNAGQGVINVIGSTIVVSNAVVLAGSDVEFHANDLVLANTSVRAGVIDNGFGQSTRGALVLDATNSFGDFGPVSSNFWITTAGIRIPTRPAAAGDLMGTQVYSTAGVFQESAIVWAGEDRGPVVEGFTNNLALGRLTLDGAQGNFFSFKGAAAGDAIYIDYLELLNGATNYNFALGVAPNFTIYIADSSVPADKLESTSGGRIRWVSQFIGPQSGTNITYPNNVTYRFNAGVVRSLDIDSDGDGILNGEDCTPIIPPGEESNPGLWFGANCGGPKSAAAKSVSTENIALTITLGSNGREVLLNWNAAANSANTVEFTDSIAGGAWQSLTNFINGPAEVRVTVKDAVNVPMRVYRVRVDAEKP